MSEQRSGYLSGSIVEETTTLTLSDLSRACCTHAEYIVELVEEGVIQPIGSSGRQWRFSGRSLIRARRAASLQRDLGLNTAGVALALELLDELERLRARLERDAP